MSVAMHRLLGIFVVAALNLLLVPASEVPHVALLQVKAGRVDLRSESAARSNLSAAVLDKLLTAPPGDSDAEVCGARLVTPQLQFQLQVYKSLGVLSLKPHRCRFPQAASLVVVNSQLHSPTMMNEAAQRRYARLVIFFWSIATIAAMSALFLTVFVQRRAKVTALEKLRSVNVSRGLALFWLEPIMGLYRSKHDSDIDKALINQIQPNFHTEPQGALRSLWQEQIRSRGLQGARLEVALLLFLTPSSVFQMLFFVGVSMFLELAGMTVVLDLLVNFIGWTDDARNRLSLLHIGTLGPSCVIILLVFCFPMLSRYFTISANMQDSRDTSRISAGLLSLIYEKSQRLPQSAKTNRFVADANQLLSNDATKAWTCALKSYAQLLVSSVWMVAFFGLLVVRLGIAALAGGCVLGLGLVFFVPVYGVVRRLHMRWSRLADRRVKMLKETLFGFRGLQAPASANAVAERILKLRSEELETKLSYSLLMGFVNIPVTLFPFALILLTLFVHLRLHGEVSVVKSKDLFTCMQVMYGLIASATVFGSALQRVMNLPNSVRRIEQFLKAPEMLCQPTPKRHFTHAEALAAQLCGSFAFTAGEPAVLHDMNLAIKKGELVAVVGETASGKSALLSAMLGEMTSTSENAIMEKPDKVAYCAQTPWMVDGMLHDNVALYGREIHRERYEAAIAAGSLATLSPGAVINTDKEYTSKFAERVPWFPYFGLWNFFSLIAIGLNIMNVNWHETPLSLGIFVVCVQGLLQWSVIEIPLQTIAACFFKNPPKLRRADASNLKLILNYNLLAVNKAGVDACLENMYEAFMGNVSNNVSAVLVSATFDEGLQNYELEVRDSYRARIAAELAREGLSWAGVENGDVDDGRRSRVWAQFEHMDRQDFAENHLHEFVEKVAQEFMVIHRISRVLRKCGQYQDLMLLSEGHGTAFTYCDKGLYGRLARSHGEPLFNPSKDVDNIRGRHFDYTLVLDADTRVAPKSAFDLLEVGAGNPNCAIVQPAIQLECNPGDSVFVHVEAMRQNINAPLTRALTTILGESGFYGKGLIKNSLYIEKCLGGPTNLVEAVPIDVLSHDTYEAMLLQPLYAGDIHLREAPCGNYVTWDIRERRWNRGELLLATYFFPNSVGVPMRMLQKFFQGQNYENVHRRTEIVPRPISAYLAHAALRQIAFKPALVLYVLFMNFVAMHNAWAPIVVVMFLIIVFPKIATCNHSNMTAVLLETTASILQFTPECVVGTIRVLRALKAHVTGNARWVPQAAVEEEFMKTNVFIFSLKHLWYYPCFALLCGMLVTTLMPEGIYVMWLLGTLLTLPFYAGLTAMRTSKNMMSSDFCPSHEDEELITQQDFKRTDQLRIKRGERNDWLQQVTIGPRGAYLSAGERAQICFARAAYHEQASLVLMDDPFALVDAATGAHLMEQLANGTLFKSRARVVALPPESEHLHRFDRLVVLDGGRVIAQGTPADVLAMDSFKILRTAEKCATSQPLVPKATPRVLELDGKVPLELESKENHMQNYWCAILAGGPWLFAGTVVVALLLRFVVTGQLLIIGIWSDSKDAHYRPIDTHYVATMFGLLFVSGVLQVIQNYLVVVFSNNVSASLFNHLVSSLIHAPADTFWGKVPVGRMLNRLAGDVMTLDTALSSGFYSFGSFFFNVLAQQVYCLYIIPNWLAFPMYVIIVCFAYFSLGASTPLQYSSLVSSSRCQEEQAQLEHSPESVRAYRLQVAQSAKYAEAVSGVMKPLFFGTSCIKQWLMFRLTFCFCFQCTVCMLYGVLRPRGTNSATVAVIALLTFNIVQELESVVDALIGSIGFSLSLDRLIELLRGGPDVILSCEERSLRAARARARAHEVLVAGGSLQVEGLVVGPSQEGTSQDGLSFQVLGGSWLGVIGGVGSGKTTLLCGLARLIEPKQGKVSLGCVDLLNIASELDRDLARLLTCYLPEVPALFADSIRKNLDPMGAMLESALWNALEACQLGGVVRAMPQGLDQDISMARLSLGQLQLLGLARCVVQQPALLLLDGSLSSVDSRTREVVYTALTVALPGTTFVLAAPRLEVAAGCDHVIVLDRGVIVSQGHPKVLCMGSN